MKTVREIGHMSDMGLLVPGERYSPDPRRVDFFRYEAAVHDYSVPLLRPAELRAIHAWTCLGVATVGRNDGVRDAGAYVALLLALEQKLAFVEHRARALRGSLSVEPAPPRPIGDFDHTLAVLADLEAYIGAIYSTLELVAAVVWEKARRTPKHFSRLAAKHPTLRFDRWHWLQHFWDLRTELTHYNTPFISLKQGFLQIRFTQSGTLRYFPSNRRARVPLDDILEYRDHLLDMLDEWALTELNEIDATWQHGIYIPDGEYVRREFEPCGVILDAVRARPTRSPRLVGPGLKAFIESDELVSSMDDLFAAAGVGKTAAPLETFDIPARALRTIGIGSREELKSLLEQYYPHLRHLARLRADGVALSPAWPGFSVLLAACVAVERVAPVEEGRAFARRFGVPVSGDPPPAGMLDIFGVIATLWRTQWAERA